VASPNARFRTAAILLESRGKWRLDASTLGVHDDRPEAQSLEALSEALADR